MRWVYAVEVRSHTTVLQIYGLYLPGIVHAGVCDHYCILNTDNMKHYRTNPRHSCLSMHTNSLQDDIAIMKPETSTQPWTGITTRMHVIAQCADFNSTRPRTLHFCMWYMRIYQLDKSRADVMKLRSLLRSMSQQKAIKPWNQGSQRKSLYFR